MKKVLVVLAFLCFGCMCGCSGNDINVRIVPGEGDCLIDSIYVEVYPDVWIPVDVDSTVLK